MWPRLLWLVRYSWLGPSRSGFDTKWRAHKSLPNQQSGEPFVAHWPIGRDNAIPLMVAVCRLPIQRPAALKAPDPKDN
jgi:hypothetical protein